MTLNADAEKAKFDEACEKFHAGRYDHVAMRHAVRYLAAQVLSVAPDATHMLLETSDQGQHMTPPMWINIGAEHTAEEEWDEFYNDHLDDLSDVAMWLEWGAHEWEQYNDDTHPASATKNGYYALDLRRIVADAEAEEPNPNDPIDPRDDALDLIQQALSDYSQDDSVDLAAQVQTILTRWTGRRPTVEE